MGTCRSYACTRYKIYKWENRLWLYIYEKVKNKRNIFKEISILSKVLAPFKDKIGMHTPVSRSINIFPVYKLNEKTLQINDKNIKHFL